MGADVSRVRFDPLRDFAGVVLQQGRVLLDADFNELVTVLERRLRAAAVDVASFGPDPDVRGTAWVPRQTPDAFALDLTGGGLTIGPGRMYVDGLLAECHGRDDPAGGSTGPTGFDDVLAEVTGAFPVPYAAQPYLDPAPELPEGGTHLAYLDVWQREVGPVEAPDLVEPALGVDTTARWQTVWQVRLHPVPAGTTCGTPDAELGEDWLDVVRPSDGRLTVGTVEVDATDDPCELPPTGGYRGLENQTYRVEVHDGGGLGEATLKWSRDAASVVVPVVELLSAPGATPVVLRLASLGRDDVLGIREGDWVEVLDDGYELDGRPGAMRRVEVDVAQRTVEFDLALPADLEPVDADVALARHLRVRRWDQRDTVRLADGTELPSLEGTGGVVTLPADPTDQVVLEHGVAVSFSLARPGGRFKPGDHWVFAARTATTSVEELAAAPPLGVHHHVARLGVVSPATGAVSDCRRRWPPLATGGGDCGDCTVCVSPEQHESGELTVQAALDLVRDTGGTVCLSTGVYDVGDGLVLEGARSVRLRGQGPASILVATGTALSVETSVSVVVERLAVLSGRQGPAGIRLRHTVDCSVEDVVVLSLDAQGATGSAVELRGVALRDRLRGNVLVGRVGVDGGGSEGPGVLAGDLRVEDCVVVAPAAGIDLGGTSAYLYDVRVTGNEVLGGDEVAAIRATGGVAPGGSLRVCDNTVAGSGGGVVVGPEARVEGNVVHGTGGRGRAARGDGILVEAGPLTGEPGDVVVSGNRVESTEGVGLAVRTPVRAAHLLRNVVVGAGTGIALLDQAQAERVVVEGNEVLDTGAGEREEPSVLGIVVLRAGTAEVTGNRVARLAVEPRDGGVVAGIAVAACPHLRIAGNVVEEVGDPEQFFSFGVGILAIGPFERAAVTDNQVQRVAGGEPQPECRWHAVRVQSAGNAGLVRYGTAFALAGTGRAGGGGAVGVAGRAIFAVAGAPERATVSTNGLAGGGTEPACLVSVRGDAVVDANQLTCWVDGRDVGLLIRASTATVATNRVLGGSATIVLEMPTEVGFAVVGNLAPGGTHLGSIGSGLPAPWSQLNPSA